MTDEVSRGVEEAVEVSVEKRSLIAKVSRKYRETRNPIQEQKLDRSTRCRGAIEEAGAFSIDPPGIKELFGLR